ncbi:MAG TPA: sugar phosphate isomerase/epimerase family protein [Chloroflexota bacterium]
MHLGLASNDIAHIAASREWGYDFVEIFAELLRPLEPDSAWPSRRRELEDTGAALTNLCAWIPGEARYVGPSPDWGRTRAFVETSVGRATEIGVRVFNWGSPNSKSIPAGWPISKAFEQIERAAHLIADVVGRYDATCVIEPINPRECNVIYYLTDGVLLASSVGRPQIKVLADFFHMSLQSEPLAHLEAARGWLGHTHTSGPERHFPLPGQAWDQRAFLSALRASGYDGRVSVESWTVRPGSTFAEDARESAAYLRGLLSDLDRSV